jgi:diguanylate cyclase (GGDEF)-like protein
VLQHRVDDTHKNLTWITPVVCLASILLLIRHLVSPVPTSPYGSEIWRAYFIILVLFLFGAVAIELVAVLWAPRLTLRVRFRLGHIAGVIFAAGAITLTLVDLRGGGVDISIFIAGLLIRAAVFRATRSFHTFFIAISAAIILAAQIIGIIDVEWFVIQSLIIVSLLAGWVIWLTEKNYESSIILQSAYAIQNNELRELSLRDPLTNLRNRRAFREHLEMSVDRCARYGGPLSLVLIDIDFFKKINDKYGHPVGDGVLTEIARLLESGTRKSDLAARYGGEEFVIIMTNANGKIAFDISERLRVKLETTAFTGVDEPVTASFGIAEYNPNGEAIDKLISRADEALYSSKRNGRNRSTISEIID